MNNNLYLLDFNENSSKLKFIGEIESIEFVELIDDMDLSYSINYVKRDLYLNDIGKKLFRLFKEIKIDAIKFENHNEYVDNIHYEKTIEVFSQDEINRLLTAINTNDENYSHN